MNRSYIMAAVFVLGCATGGAASRYVSEARAEPPPQGTTQWAYHCVKDDNVERIQEHANKLGKSGWELASSALSGGASVSSPIWCFKKPR